MREELPNPLATGKAIGVLLERFDALGLAVAESTNFDRFERIRADARPGVMPTVYFDVDINEDLGSHAAWYHVRDNESGATVALIAHRVDYIQKSLADWIAGQTVTLHRRRGEHVVPRFEGPVENSRAASIRGWVVYQGEMFVSDAYAGKGLGNLMNQFGCVMHYFRWSPDFSWAIISEKLIKGMFFGSGFAHREQGYILDWTIGPDVDGEQREPWVSLNRQEMAALADHLVREAERDQSKQSDPAGPG